MRISSNNFLVLLLLFLIIVDQVTKKFFFNWPRDFGFFAITPVTNTGMSFGLFQGNNTMLMIISVLFIILLLFFRKEFKDGEIFLVFILAGAVGNLIDRILHGHVLDFFNFKFFPVFNVADSLIFVGVVSILFLEIKQVFKKNKKSFKKKLKN